MPKVTVWLTSYNHEKYIKQSIESILNQTYQDWELIIIDDCSKDSSWKIIKEYEEKDNRIRAIQHEINRGGSYMVEKLDIIHGEYVAMAHSDDAWQEDKLEKQVALLEENSDIGACFTLVHLIDDEGKVFTDKDHPYSKVFEMENRSRTEWLNHFFYNGNCLCHPSILIRKIAYTDWSIIPNGLHGLPDFCQWIRLCKKSNIYILQEYLTYFRVHTDESNTSGDTAPSLNRLRTETYFVLQEYLSIRSTNEIVKIFPEANQFVKEENNTKYILSRLLLNGPSNMHRLLGLQLIYELYNEGQGKELKHLYNYTKKDYNLDKQKYDIFNLIPQEQYMNSTLYYLQNGNFDEEHTLKEKVYVTQSGHFCVQFDLKEIDISDFENELRLDLDEGRFRRFSLTEVAIDGKMIECIPVNGKKSNNLDVFLTVVPQYKISNAKKGFLKIYGKTEVISLFEITKYYEEMIYELQNKNIELETKLRAMEETRGYQLLQKARKLRKKVLRR